MIAINQLCLSTGEDTVLDKLSFDVRCGETVALLGASGAGKSTLAKLLLGLVPGRLADSQNRQPLAKGQFRWSGSAWIDGVDVLRAKPSAIRALRGSRVGMLMQGLSDALNPHRTVIQHVHEVIGVHGLHGADAPLLCEKCHIPKRLYHRYPAALSGGEIQRVLMALACVCRPPYLIFDEPTSALDAVTQAQIVQTFKEGADRRCQLLIAHDVDLIASIANRVCVLHKGRIVESGTTDEVLSRPQHPYTRRLLGGKRPSPNPPIAHRTPNRPVNIRPGAGLRIQGLSHRYGDRPVLKSVSAFVPAGSCLVVTGPSGVGKSTLARVLTGFETKQHGRVFWSWGQSPQNLNGTRHLKTGPETAHGLYDYAALVPQLPHRAMARHFTVQAVLKEALRFAQRRRQVGDPHRSKKGTLTIQEVLDMVGLPTHAKFLQRRSAQLSGGEAQKLVIARGLILQPRYLVADEPTAALDLLSKSHMLSCFNRLKKEQGIALIVFTHDLPATRHIADQVVCLQEGRFHPVASP
ncbi:ABC transporter ATP-binding protein [Microbulbifer spongiae]|uniref:ATP-binding cassette domain-containing protein n=1 Tax=Microbulbifer spongiae TaxID=2944933 RepID=A0ABY9EDQ2_9GAMM|nr:ATP-binding cassette domain-containing protein [Microbulbifer sp. MI-G]WKD50163.1 ATP-binding cassette domain-containing protein [Microbulbifer sp. MI-G]